MVEWRDWAGAICGYALSDSRCIVVVVAAFA